MENAQSNPNIRKEVQVGQLTVSRVFENMYQKEGTLTAELRQTVTTKSYYPSKQIANEMQDNIFGQGDFGFEEQEYTNQEHRVSWIDVPVGTTKEQVEQKLASFGEAGLYRVLSNHPILTSGQVYAINQGLTTKDAIAESQIVRFPEGAENAGGIALDPNGKPQYRGIFFATKIGDGEGEKHDIDNRTSDPEDLYVSDAIKIELAPAGAEAGVEGQSLQMR